MRPAQWFIAQSRKHAWLSYSYISTSETSHTQHTYIDSRTRHQALCGGVPYIVPYVILVFNVFSFGPTYSTTAYRLSQGRNYTTINSNTTKKQCSSFPSDIRIYTAISLRRSTGRAIMTNRCGTYGGANNYRVGRHTIERSNVFINLLWIACEM